MFHLTTYEAAKAIIDTGFIDPEFSQGRQKVMWYVSSRMITWAIPHVCQRHECGVDQVVVFTVKTPQTEMRRSSRRGVYVCGIKLPIVEMQSATMVLQREERAVFVQGARRRRTYGYRW
jgi:hypothetical protein